MKRKEGNKWVVRSKAGKKLGEHTSEAQADRQLAAIEASKARRKRAKGRRRKK